MIVKGLPSAQELLVGVAVDEHARVVLDLLWGAWSMDPCQPPLPASAAPLGRLALGLVE